MAVQSRAKATRQIIIDAAVELFVDKGYGDTGLSDITKQAHVTTGAFYYHFDSKEDLARAIMDQGWPKAVEVLDRYLSAPAAGLEGVIAMTFTLSNLMKRDKSVWISNHLNQAFGQLSEEGRRTFKDHAEVFIERMADAMHSTELHRDVTRAEVGAMVWTTLHGCHLLSDAMMDSVIERLETSWLMLLPGIVPEGALNHFQRVVTDAADAFRGADGRSQHAG